MLFKFLSLIFSFLFIITGVSYGTKEQQEITSPQIYHIPQLHSVKRSEKHLSDYDRIRNNPEEEHCFKEILKSQQEIYNFLESKIQSLPKGASIFLFAEGAEYGSLEKKLKQRTYHNPEKVLKDEIKNAIKEDENLFNKLLVRCGAAEMIAVKYPSRLFKLLPSGTEESKDIGWDTHIITHDISTKLKHPEDLRCEVMTYYRELVAIRLMQKFLNDHHFLIEEGVYLVYGKGHDFSKYNSFSKLNIQVPKNGKNTELKILRGQFHNTGTDYSDYQVPYEDYLDRFNKQKEYIVSPTATLKEKALVGLLNEEEDSYSLERQIRNGIIQLLEEVENNKNFFSLNGNLNQENYRSAICLEEDTFLITHFFIHLIEASSILQYWGAFEEKPSEMAVAFAYFTFSCMEQFSLDVLYDNQRASSKVMIHAFKNTAFHVLCRRYQENMFLHTVSSLFFLRLNIKNTFHPADEFSHAVTLLIPIANSLAVTFINSETTPEEESFYTNYSKYLSILITSGNFILSIINHNKERDPLIRNTIKISTAFQMLSAMTLAHSLL